jgi:hypothetical protein
MRFFRLLTLAAFIAGTSFGLHANAADTEITEKSFGCIHDGATKVRNTFIRHTDPAKLKEAVRILETKATEEYPVGTMLQLVPFEAMVKHEKAKFPKTNGWEFFFLEVSAEGTKIVNRGENAANRGGTCLSCHQAAQKFDYVCEKGHGCAPIPVTDEQIVAIQGKDARCTAKP